MLLAIPEWRDRISPVFDEALYFKIYHIESGKIIEIADKNLPDLLKGRQIEFLSGSGVEILICGAISKHMQREAEIYGIRVVPFLAGITDVIIDEWLSDTWHQERFIMPGCRQGRRRGRRNCMKKELNKYKRR